MKWFDRFTEWLDARERADERKALCRERQQLEAHRNHIERRIPMIAERLRKLREADQAARFGKPVLWITTPTGPKFERYVVEEDDCSVPDGLVGEWKAPA